MRLSALVLALTFAIACGDSREQPAADPVDEPAPVTEDPLPIETDEQVGLSDAERKRLEKEYAAEARDRITAENAESVGERLLTEVERELAAELKAVDAGTD